MKLRKQNITSLATIKKIKPFDMVYFTRQLSTMLNAGIPLAQSLAIIGKLAENQRLKQLISIIQADVESGITFSKSLQKHPKQFTELFCNLIDIGEKSGSLEEIITKLANYQEKIISIKSRIKKALFYPIAVISITLLVTSFLLIFVIPQFESLFVNFGAELPMMTQLLISFAQFFQSYWYFIFSFFGIIIFTFIKTYQKILAMREIIDRFLLSNPFIGTLVKKSVVARFCTTLNISFSAGLSLLDSLKLTSKICGNKIFYKEIIRICDDVVTGQQLHQSMVKTLIFPPMVIQMIAIGETSGSLEMMLSKISDYYEEEISHTIHSLSHLIEPAMMTLLGIIVGTLVIAMYLPIFKLGSVM